MKTSAKKFLPLGTLVLFMAFFLSGCDAVLETLYPEFGDKGKYGGEANSVTIAVTWDNAVKNTGNNIVVYAVPYVFDNSLQAETPNVDAAVWGVLPSNTTQTAASPAKVILPFSPFDKYKVVVFVEQTLGMMDPSKTQAMSIQVKSGKLDKFGVSDVKGDLLANLTGNSKMPVNVYSEIFATDIATQSEAWSIDGPSSATLADNLTLAKFDFTRPPSTQVLKDLSTVLVSVYGPKSIGNAPIFQTVGKGNKFNLATSSSLATEFTFDMAGSYTIYVDYWFAGDSVMRTVTSTVQVLPSAEAANNTAYTIALSLSAYNWGLANGDLVWVQVYDPVANAYSKSWEAYTYGGSSFSGFLNVSGIVPDSAATFTYHSGVHDQLQVYVNGYTYYYDIVLPQGSNEFMLQ